MQKIFLLICIFSLSIISSCGTDENVTVPTNNLVFELNQDGTYSVLCDAFHRQEIIEVVIPETYLGLPVTCISDHAFVNCVNLKSVTIPNGVIVIDDYAFKGCTSLTEILIPNSIKKIGDYAFEECTNLSVVNIELDSKLETIGFEAFIECSNLKSIVIPKSVTSIEDNTFFLCKKLTDVFYTGSQSDWDKIAIGERNNDLLAATIHYNYSK